MIAVTGSNGLLGSYIVRKLVTNNIPFVALKRKGSNLSLLHDLKESITWRDIDITDAVSVEEALEGVSGVIHTAAYVSFNPRKADTIFQINTEGTRNVVNACLVSNVKRLVHISSVAALGRQKGQDFLSEENKWIDSGVNSMYGKSKYKAELEVFRGQEEGLSTVILNPSVILGYSNWDKSSTQLFKYVWHERPFYINGSLNYVDVRDVADAAVQLFHSSIEGERFIVSGGSIPFKGFFDKTALRFEKKAPSVKVNATLAKLLARIEGVRTWFTGSEPIITRETARLIDTFFQYDNLKLKKAINFNFQTIDATLEWCCEEYKKQHGIKNK
jgi:dihydroflavonol-4-reductase